MPPRLPETPRQIVLGGQSVAYQLRRSARRTIGLSIDRRGLRVGAPTRATLGDIEGLIRLHADWVLDKLATWRELPSPAKPEIADGMTLFILGEAWTVRFADSTRSRWLAEQQIIQVDGATAPTALNRALRERARHELASRLAYQAARFGVATPPLRLSSARTRWGSCSARGNIALNWKLILLPPAVVDYVVCHELAHLKEMNHSPRFWSVVESLYPDWRAQRLELRRLARQLPNL